MFSNPKPLLFSLATLAATGFSLWAHALLETGNSYSPIPNPSADAYRNVEYTLGITGKVYEDQYNKDTLSAFSGKLTLEEKWSEKLQANAEVLALFEQGASQGLKNQSTRKDSGFYLLDASATYQPFESFQFSAGALSQKNQFGRLIVGARPFPGARQKFSSSSGNFESGLTLQQLVPSSHKLSSKAVEKEKTPTYITALAHGKYTFQNDFYIQVGIGYFEFQNLPSEVAKESCFLGNSTTGNCLTGTQFSYEYAGFLGQLTMETSPRKSYQLGVYGEVLYNHRTFEGLREGYLGSAYGKFHIGSDSTLKFGFEYFEKQSDAAPAYYASFLKTGNTRGGALSIEHESLLNHLILGMDYTRTTALAPTTFQSQNDYFRVKLEKSYE